MEISPDGADMNELRADSHSSPCDILRSLPLDCFELGWTAAMQYTTKETTASAFSKGKNFSLSYVDWHRG
jgi:hypothetical protein